MMMMFAVGAREDGGILQFRTARRTVRMKATPILQKLIAGSWELRWAVCQSVWLVSPPRHNYASFMELLSIPAAGFILA